jgi:hypothetical protein
MPISSINILKAACGCAILLGVVGVSDAASAPTCQVQPAKDATKKCEERYMIDCLPAAQLDGDCARVTTGTPHYVYLFSEAVMLGLYSSVEGGKQERPLLVRTTSIMQSIAVDNRAPVLLRRLSKTTVAKAHEVHPTWFSKP